MPVAWFDSKAMKPSRRQLIGVMGVKKVEEREKRPFRPRPPRKPVEKLVRDDIGSFAVIVNRQNDPSNRGQPSCRLPANLPSSKPPSQPPHHPIDQHRRLEDSELREDEVVVAA